MSWGLPYAAPALTSPRAIWGVTVVFAAKHSRWPTCRCFDAVQIESRAASHRRSLRSTTSVSRLSAAELMAQHKSCTAAAKTGKYKYTTTRCATCTVGACPSPMHLPLPSCLCICLEQSCSELWSHILRMGLLLCEPMLCNASSTCLRSVHSSVFPCPASSVWRRTPPIDALHHVCVLMTLHVTDLFMQGEHDLCMPRSWLIATDAGSREQLTQYRMQHHVVVTAGAPRTVVLCDTTWPPAARASVQMCCAAPRRAPQPATQGCTTLSTHGRMTPAVRSAQHRAESSRLEELRVSRLGSTGGSCSTIGFGPRSSRSEAGARSPCRKVPARCCGTKLCDQGV